jgi:hypothetical protein
LVVSPISQSCSVEFDRIGRLAGLLNENCLVPPSCLFA